MVEPKIENLIDLAKEIAQERYELFGCEDHIAAAMDRILPGPAYLDSDSIDEKLDKLFARGLIYVEHDRIFSEHAIDKTDRRVIAATQRHTAFNEHRKLFEGKIKKEGRLPFLNFLCQTNGMFLGREVLNRSFTFWTHAALFDAFVQKNPSKPVPMQDDVKIRLVLMPRGSFKSTADGVDCAQWIINFPDIRIMFLTAAKELAKAFVGEVKGYFTARENIELTPFQCIIGPRFLISEEQGNEGKEEEFICPSRSVSEQQKKEVTLWAGSIGSTKVGMHCEIVKADDGVDDKNTETPQLIAKTNRRIGMALNLLDPGCFNDNLGTPYAINDWYGHVGKNIDDVLTLIRPAKWLRKDINGTTAIDRGIAEKDLEDKDWTLLFPEDKNGVEKLSHRILKKVQQRDPEGFPSQYMLNCTGYKKVQFTHDLMQARSIGPDRLPSGWEQFQCFITWDLADTATNVSDYSVGGVFKVDREGRAFVIDVYRERYSSFSELCYAIADANHKYKPQRIVIENARGAEKLRGDMVRAAQDMGDKTIPLDFVKVVNVKAAKTIRIGKLQPKLQQGRLWILNTISCYEDLIDEFVNYGSAIHDDIPDSLGFCEHFLEDARSTPQDPVAAAAAQRILDAKAFDELIYGSPESFIDRPIEPLPGFEEGGTGTDQAGDLWNPFGTPGFTK